MHYSYSADYSTDMAPKKNQVVKPEPKKIPDAASSSLAVELLAKKVPDAAELVDPQTDTQPDSSSPPSAPAQDATAPIDPIKDTELAASAATLRADTTSAATPRADTPLAFLNPTTAKFAAFDVCTTNGHHEEYEYTWDNAVRKTKVWRTILVSTQDNSQYCLGEVKKEKDRPPNVVDSAKDIYKDGLKFRLNAVELRLRERPEFNNASVKVTVDLHSTKTNKLLQDATVHTPKPSITCAECVSFQQLQHFDITACIKEVSVPRPVSGRRHVREVTLLDGSTDEHGQIVCPKVSVFYDKDNIGDDPPFMQSLVDNVMQPVPFTFLCLNAKNTSSGTKIETSRTWYKIQVADGPRADKLIAEHAAVEAAMENTEVRILEKKWTPEDGDGPSDDKLNELDAQETFCAHLTDMCKVTGIASIDDKPTVWQTNWVFVTIVPGNILTTAGDKIWLTVKLEDVSGQVMVRMNQKVAFELSSYNDKDEFAKAYADGDPVFPTILSVKVARRIKIQEREITSGSPEKQTFVNLTILAACTQDLAMARTKPSMFQLTLMRSFSLLSQAILPASFSMMLASNVYPLVVQYPIANLRPQPCSKVWMLLKATKKSTCTENLPYVVTTDDVEDALDIKDDGAPVQKFRLVSMCNKDNRTSLMLTPGHGKHVFALAVITSMKDNEFFAEIVETIQQVEKDTLAITMRQEMTLAVELMKHAATGLVTTWDDTTSPLVSQRCRVLGKSPTGPPLEALESPLAKKTRID